MQHTCTVKSSTRSFHICSWWRKKFFSILLQKIIIIK
jgi:hypothetical protein